MVLEIETRVLDGACGPLTAEVVEGPDDLPAVVVHPGSPGSRLLFPPAAAHALERHHLRLVSYDRPGYGTTPARPGRSVADAAAEVAQLVDGLGLTRVGVLGVSGGGPYALASAALLPGTVSACCVVAGLAPYGAPGLDFAASWSDEHRREVELFFEDRPLAREHFRTEAGELVGVLGRPEGWLERWGEAAGRDEAHSRALAEHLARQMADCLQGGDEGWWDDWASYLLDWGVPLDAIGAPVSLVYGAEDRSVPPEHGRALARLVGHAELEVVAGADHSTIEPEQRCRVYEWLRRAAR
ncbi:MAG TPA: alpha/beta fold hydrolase [Acidimicrobiales bacterium]|nr:alpha/beta fold hydrolase [Acidimicrobiales bacterium]